MAEQIHLVPEQLVDEAEVFGHAGRRIELFTQELVGRMNSHNPAAGDATGQAIGEKYFANAQALLNTGALAGALLADMADLIVDMARHGGRVDKIIMGELEDDLESYDPKRTLGGGPGADDATTDPRGAVRH